MTYTKSSQLTTVEDGTTTTTRDPDETVDAAYVERFIATETLDWFRNLGGTEQVKRRNGVVTVRSTNPDGTESRLTVFDPIRH